jgi:2-polyprenyl-6-methoxyphenol hydroxylase-like FAD-dependent oxidoreductase
MAAKNPFRVIIAGGSVTGLALANALEQAGIDFVLLEKREIAPNLGASISVLPHTAKVFEQLGVWDTMKRATIPLVRHQHFDDKGRMFDDTREMELVSRKSGKEVIFMERRFYLQTLYNNLKDKNKVKTSVGLVSYEDRGETVVVMTNTGEKIEGSILVGADGIHSATRGCVAKAVEKSDVARYKQLTEGERIDIPCR